jgi:hypothetical protein
MSFPSIGQSNVKDFYYQLPEYSDAYSAGMVASRMIDGLGFRYYWGALDLREEDLIYRPSKTARSLEETLDHILNLAAIINTTSRRETFAGLEIKELSYQEKRALTLEYLQSARELLQNMDDQEIGSLRVKIGASTDLPFWNLINGPIADAINHVGQIITFRRTNGNPINPNINVLKGTVNEE